MEKGRSKFHTAAEGAAWLRDWIDAHVSACRTEHRYPADAEADLMHR